MPLIDQATLQGTSSAPKRAALAGLWSLADQTLVSLTNFLTMVLLARRLSPGHFGEFLVVYTVLLFLNELQKALITRPHNVLAAPLSGSVFASFTGTALLFQVVFAGGLTLIALVVASIALAGGLSVGLLLLALAGAIFSWQLQEFTRQVFYTRGFGAIGLSCDVISYAGQAVLIGALFAAERLSGVSAMCALALTSAVAAVPGFWFLRHELGPADRGLLLDTWRFGRWLLGDGLGSWLSSQIYPLLTAAVVGLPGIAAWRAVQNLIGAGHIIMNAFVAFAVPRAVVVEVTKGQAAMKSFVLRSGILAGVPLLLYWGAATLFAAPALHLLYGDKYQSYSSLVGLMALSYVAQYVTIGQTVALLSLKRASVLFAGRLVAIAITFTVGFILVLSLGLYGAVVGSTLSFIGLGIFLSRSLNRAGGETPPVFSQAGLAMDAEL